MSTPTFVVGTGRCGSTMLSSMLRVHPHVLSLSEFFGFLGAYGARLADAFSQEPIDGRRFWTIVAAINPLSRFAYRHRVTCAEQLYPYEAADSRFSSATGVPAILQTTLPHLADDPDTLFDLLAAEIYQWPAAMIGESYNRLFRWLAAHFGKSLWIERSGTSLRLIEELVSTFPGARFIHITRDGRDAAVSMQEHSIFRLGLAMTSLEQFLGVDPLESSDRTGLDRVPDELRALLPERFDGDAFRAFRVPLPVCGEYWAFQIDTGLKLLRALPADRLLTLRYEDFLIDPKRQLDRFAAFLGEEFVDEDWSARCAATVRPPRSSWRDLPEDEARALTEACRPGFEALAAAGVEYEL
jgi:putative sulfotransferase